MAYMEGEFYVWQDGENIHINDASSQDKVLAYLDERIAAVEGDLSS